MQDILAISLYGMQQDMARLERIGANMANALTPGYKRDVTAARPVPSSFMPAGHGIAASRFADALKVAAGGAVAADPVSPDAMLIQTDFRPGTLKSTGQALDLALGGAGYFEVMTEAGPAYTRQGDFRLDSRGRLVSAQGLPVMGRSGEIYLDGDRPVIDAAGRIFDAGSPGGAPLAQLKVVRFDAGSNPQRLGGGLFAAPASATQMNDAEVQVRQGFLENANVSAMQEMVALIQTMRHFETMQKIAVGYDEMMGTAIRKLGEAT